MPERAKATVQASVVTYELHTLGWKAFQDLCVSVTSEVLGQTVQAFLPGNDGGRDGAFHGKWKPKSGEALEGPFTVQCKFSAKRDKVLRLAALAEEITKAKRLVEKGLARNYVLMTNAGLSAVAEAEIRQAFVDSAGVTNFTAFGGEWISQRIREIPKLRMLVPRVYGLGDLSQILDERGYAQARKILSAMGDDLAKFVITDAFNRSADALVKHGFVLLLGEPASGKSTIAAALAVGALDLWGCSTLKIRGADDFVAHWNPHEPRQFFWVDDAFGPTQYDAGAANEWNRVFSHLESAIHRGARVLFTSRDYIYKAARRNLKEGAFPLIVESQVVIDVGKLTKAEKEQILYNHIKLGSQPKAYRRLLKPFLPMVAANPHFLPEIARRLSNPVFTGELALTEERVTQFVEEPLDFLLGVLHSLDNPGRAAIALVFMCGGSLASPVTPSLDEARALELLGGHLADVREALNALDGSLVKRALEGGRYVWSFKHPTIRDAFASLVAEDPELLDIYLAGTPPEKLVHEISCGPSDIQGVKVIVPSERYAKVVQRLDGIAEKRQLHWFLTYRCDKDFLSAFLTQNPTIFEQLRHWGAYLSAFSEVTLLGRLHECGLLPEAERLAFVEGVLKILEFTLDDGFLKNEWLKAIFTPQELKKALELVEDFLVNRLDEEINDTARDFSARDSGTPESHFDTLSSALTTFQEEFRGAPIPSNAIEQGKAGIQEKIQELEEECATLDEDYEGHDGGRLLEGSGDRSVFDDIDD
jgi:hypothetical protein